MSRAAATQRPALPDFPFYAGHPIGFSAARWFGLLGAVVAGFLALSVLPADRPLSQLAARLVFVGMPLGVLWAFAGRHVGALFGRLTTRDVGIALAATVLSVLAALLAALLVQRVAPVEPNALVAANARLSGVEFVGQLLSTAPQLVGEELLTLLPFLAVMRLATWAGVGRRVSIALAVILSTALFCAAHLPTYDWHWLQCFGVIGASRVVLTLAYVLTRKLWVPALAHILNDWSEMTLAFLAATATATAQA